jgi:hypothetical protein
MIKFLVSIFIISSLSLPIFSQPTVDGRFVEITNNGTSYVVKVQIKTNTGTDILGDATIAFTFNTANIAYVSTTFNNFSGGDYALATATNSPTNRISLNIVLTNTSGGTIVSSTFMDVATITFNTTNPAGSSNLIFTLLEFYSPLGAGWDIGTFTNLNTNPLPVELSSFTTKFVNDKIQLKWVTKSEVNNYGFNVERKINESEWNSIGFVKGNGTTTETKKYSFTDEDLFNGGNKFYYRLKQIDNDGTFKYSDIVEVKVVPTQFELSQNYPNPFNPTTTIRFSLPQQTSLKINIYNMLGELVETIAEGIYEAGFHKVTFSAKGGSSLPSGVYIYRMEGTYSSTGIGQSFVQSKKMILIK